LHFFCNKSRTHNNDDRLQAVSLPLLKVGKKINRFDSQRRWISLKKTQRKKSIRRIGPDKGGHWEILAHEPWLVN